jgi:hypothetical protein
LRADLLPLHPDDIRGINDPIKKDLSDLQAAGDALKNAFEVEGKTLQWNWADDTRDPSNKDLTYLYLHEAYFDAHL